MSHALVRLPEELRRLAESRAAETGHDNIDDYVADLVRADTGLDLSGSLEAELLEGLDSGAPIELTPELRKQLRRSFPPES